ncbi:MAG: hypothetical protein EA413_05280 [Cyanobium sp. PLM2.Bin73]|nr:MAG: hypothetical protein EA413_05280 [Cyanobium sp. PLM2.Bin73]
MGTRVNPRNLNPSNVKPGDFPAVALITATGRGGNGLTGSGFAIGRRWLLTASHVVYNKAVLGGLARNLAVYPSYNPNRKKNNVTFADKLYYFSQVDPDGDGFIASGDGKKRTLSGAEIDIALIRTKRPILNSGESGFELKSPFQGKSRAGVLGYGYEATRHGPRLIGSTGRAIKSSVDNTVFYKNLNIKSGMSGGPVFTRDGVVSPVSTASFGASLDAHIPWIEKAIKGGGRRRGRSIDSQTRSESFQDTDQGQKGDDRITLNARNQRVNIGNLARRRSLADLKAFRSRDDIVDQLTGLPLIQRSLPDDTGFAGRGEFPRIQYTINQFESDNITLLSAKRKHVSRLVGDMGVFQNEGVHIFAKQQLSGVTNGKALIIISDATPGYQRSADRVFLHRGRLSLGLEMLSPDSISSLV